MAELGFLYFMNVICNTLFSSDVYKKRVHISQVELKLCRTKRVGSRGKVRARICPPSHLTANAGHTNVLFGPLNCFQSGRIFNLILLILFWALLSLLCLARLKELKCLWQAPYLPTPHKCQLKQKYTKTNEKEDRKVMINRPRLLWLLADFHYFYW